MNSGEKKIQYFKWVCCYNSNYADMLKPVVEEVLFFYLKGNTNNFPH